MSEGLLYVESEPGEVPEPEFNDWYDTEHAPARMNVPGIESGHRYRALDGRTPSWLACYELSTLSALATPEYARLRHRSPREQRVVDRLAVLDRRVYELLDAHGSVPADASPAPVVVAVALGTSGRATGEAEEAGKAAGAGEAGEAEEALHEWYLDEHIPLLHSLPTWWRTRRYRLVEGTGPALLALHEIGSTALFDTEPYREATSTRWRERVMRHVTWRERRVFGHYRTYGTASG